MLFNIHTLLGRDLAKLTGYMKRPAGSPAGGGEPSSERGEPTWLLLWYDTADGPLLPCVSRPRSAKTSCCDAQISDYTGLALSHVMR